MEQEYESEQDPISTEDLWRFYILSKMTKDVSGKVVAVPKIAIEIGYVFSREEGQKIFEELLLKDWLRLIDIVPLVSVSGKLMKIYRVMPEAIEWYNDMLKEYNRG